MCRGRDWTGSATSGNGRPHVPAGTPKERASLLGHNVALACAPVPTLWAGVDDARLQECTEPQKEIESGPVLFSSGRSRAIALSRSVASIEGSSLNSPRDSRSRWNSRRASTCRPHRYNANINCLDRRPGAALPSPRGARQGTSPGVRQVGAWGQGTPLGGSEPSQCGGSAQFALPRSALYDIRRGVSLGREAESRRVVPWTGGLGQAGKNVLSRH